MPRTITDSDGNEIEVYDPQEFETEKQKVVEDYRKNNPDKTEEVEKLKKDLEAKEKELAGMKPGNTPQTPDINKIVEEKVQEAKKEILESSLKDHYNEALKQLVGDDEELRKKIEFNYNRLTDIAASKEEVAKKLIDSWRLATATEQDKTALNTAVISSGGVAKLNIKDGGKSFSAEEKGLLDKLGAAGGLKITDEDIKKYGQ